MTAGSIDPRRWSAIRAAFDELVDLEAPRQAERLQEIAATDPELRSSLERLLAADAAAAEHLGRIDDVFASGARIDEQQADPLQLAGKEVSHFRIIEPLARGGMGVVYRAHDTQLQRAVAIKFPLPAQRLESRAKQRFIHEARAAGALDHPNLCSIHETGETADGELFLVMALYDGETLKERLARSGALSVAESMAIARQIARGLAAAHAAGIVHRDLKPGNVMLLPDGTVKLLDFGLAKVEDVTLTASHARVGTAAYMAPEQIRGDAIDGRADLWSLGVLAYEMLTGKRPFAGEHDVSIVHAIMNDQPPLPSTLRREVPQAIDDVIVALLQKDRAKRQASAEQVAAELDAIALGHTLPARVRWSRRATASMQKLRARGRRSAIALFAASALILIAAGWLTADLLRPDTRLDHSVAVLPFAHAGSASGADYLSAGLLDGLINQLDAIHDVRVATRQQAMSYQSSSKAIPQIAAELKVAAVLQGTVHKIGDRIRVKAALLHGKTQDQLWANDYDRPSTELLGIQEEIARAIAATLGVRVTVSEQSNLTRRPTANAQAYELYLRGHEYELRIPTPEVQLGAETLYKQALQLDPDFALARARLAAISLEIFGNGFDPDPARLEQARVDAEAALRLQPDLPDARLALGSYYGYKSEHAQALEEFKRGLTHAPNNAELQAAVGYAYTGLRRLPEAIAALERALQLDPEDVRIAWALAGAHRTARQYAQAVKYENYVIARAPDGYMHMLSKGHDYVLWQGSADTLAAMIKLVKPTWNNGGALTRARLVAARLQRRPADAIAALNDAREDDINQYRPATILRGHAYEAAGDGARAISHYEAARRAWSDSVKAHPDDAHMKVLLGLAYAGLGRVRDAEQQARRALAMAVHDRPAPDRFVMIVSADLFARTRNAEAAVAVLDKMMAIPAGQHISIALLRVDPMWDAIRSAPSFQRLLAKYSR